MIQFIRSHPISAAVTLAGATAFGWALVVTAPQVPSLPGSELLTLLAFLAVVAVGETARVTILTGRDTTPISTAAAFGLILSDLDGGTGHPLSAATVVLAITVGMVGGSLLRGLRGAGAGIAGTSARVIGVTLAALLYRQVDFGGHTLLAWQAAWSDRRWLVAITMLAVGGVAVLFDLTLEGGVRAERDGAPLRRSIVDEYRAAAGLSTALVISGALIALAGTAIGIAALPLFLFPLILTYFAVQRFASIRTTYRETIGALSSLTDVAGYTLAGHGERVSTLSVAMGRDLGLSSRALTDLEYAALLHDLGQVALRAPIPSGATVMAAPADQQRIAHDGAEIVRSTGVLDTVAEVLEAQTAPYRQVREFGQDLPMSSRIIKVANAYDDIAGPDGSHDDRAMERIHLGLGYEYDPRVVDSLTRILVRRRRVAGR